MDRIEAWGVVDKLVNWIFGGIILSKGEVLPLIVVGDSKRGKECSDVRKGCLKTVDVIEKPKRDDIRNVIEATIGKHISVVRDCIVMVHVGHVSGNHSNSMLVEKFMTDASLSFNEKNFTEGTSE